MTTPRAIGWSPERTHTGGCHEHAVWRDCPTCWAQGRIWEPSRWAHGALTHHAAPCPTCLGVRQVMVDAA